MKIFSAPSPDYARQSPNNGIHAVVLALEEHLKDVQWMPSQDGAELVISHAGAIHGKANAPIVSICHGLHPTGTNSKTSDVHFEVNRYVIEDLTVAKEVIVPSEWVAEVLRRDMYLKPTVIQWGINYAEWQVSRPVKQYILWNKNRLDPVCDPAPMQQVAARLPHHSFVTTYGTPQKNVNVIGRQTRDAMQNWIGSAAVYLATTKETGDIGSREALAAGVPVVAYDWGAVRDVVEHGVTGVLVPPHDLDALAWGIEYALRFRKTLSRNARHRAKRFDWSYTIPLVEGVLRRALNTNPHAYDVAVVIPCYNYGRFLRQCVESVLASQTARKLQVIIVNDGSTDDSKQVGQALAKDYPNVTLINQKNAGVAEARNAGILKADAPLVACLDADDALDPAWVEACAAVMTDPFVGIAYTRLKLMAGGGTEWLSTPFDYEAQISGQNQIPTCALFRREDALRIRGYRQYMKPAEDADFFTRLLTFTGKRAVKAGSSPLFIYRVHPESVTAHFRAEGKTDPFILRGTPTWGTKRPIAAPVNPADKLPSNPVRAYDDPVIEVIAEHPLPALLRDALEMQTLHQWGYAPQPNAPLVYRLNGKGFPPDLFERAALGQAPDDDGRTKGVVMAKSCCGGRLVVRKTAIMNSDNFVLARYLGGNKGTQSLSSPSNAVNPETGKKIYYRVKEGAQLLVHKDDIAARPDLFAAVVTREQVEVEIRGVFKQPAPPALLPDVPKTDPAPPKHLSVNVRTVEGIAGELGVSEQAVKRWIREQNLQPVETEGNRRYYDISEFKALAKQDE